MKKTARVESITAFPVRGKVQVILTVFDSENPEVTHKQSIHINARLLEKGELTMETIMRRLKTVENQRKLVKDVKDASQSLIGKTGEFEAR